MKPTQRQPILAEHIWKRDQKGRPLRNTFSKLVWGSMPKLQYQGQQHRNAGWKIVEQLGGGVKKSNVPTPPEAKEVGKSNDNIKKDTIKKVSQALEDGDTKAVTVKELSEFIRDKGLKVSTAQAKSAIFKDIKEQV